MFSHKCLFRILRGGIEDVFLTDTNTMDSAVMPIAGIKDQDILNGCVIAISGTPYAGKSKLLLRFIKDKRNDWFTLHRRISTRPKRPIENKAPAYVLLKPNVFNAKEEQGEFIIVEENFKYKWGLCKAEIFANLSKNKPSMIVTNVNDGFRKIREYWKNALLIFISPVRIQSNYTFDRGELRHSLNSRIKTDNRALLCSMEELIDYCSREIRYLSEFSGLSIIHNQDGERGFEYAYKSFESLIRHYAMVRNMH